MATFWLSVPGLFPVRSIAKPLGLADEIQDQRFVLVRSTVPAVTCHPPKVEPAPTVQYPAPPGLHVAGENGRLIGFAGQAIPHVKATGNTTRRRTAGQRVPNRLALRQLPRSAGGGTASD